LNRRLRALPIGLSVLVGVLIAGSAAAYATSVLHGRAELVAPAADLAQLQVSGVHLASPPRPGETVGLVFTVRNNTKAAVTVDRVIAQLPLRDARPAGCTSKLSGPLMSRSGFRLTGDQRVLLAPREQRQVTVPKVLMLSAAARTGCGFRVSVDVQAVPTPHPTATPTNTPPIGTSPPPTTVPADPTMITTPPTSPTITPPPTIGGGCDPEYDPYCDPTGPTSQPTTVIPPTLPTDDCDPVYDPTCPKS
jgi:hypothetical protein